MNKYGYVAFVLVTLLLAACGSVPTQEENAQHQEQVQTQGIDSSNYVPMKTTKEEDKAIRDYWINVVGFDDIYEFAGEDPTDQEKYLGMAFQLMYKELNCHGYKRPDDELAYRRMKEIFGSDFETTSNRDLYKLRLYRFVSDTTDEKGRKEQREAMGMRDGQYSPFWRYYVFDPRYNIIAKNLDMRDLSGLSGYEFDDDYNVTKVGVVTSNFKNNLQLLYQNNYVFYGSKSAFTWLRQHNSDFLTDLCRLYGYDTVPEINRLVIADVEENWYDYSDKNRFIVAYRDFFARHDGLGRLCIHEGILQYLCSYLNDCQESDFVRFDMVFTDYKENIVQSLRGKVPPFLEEFTKEERMKIAAYIGYYYDRAVGITTYEPFREELVDNEEFVSYIKENGYFGLEGFPETMERLTNEAIEWRETLQGAAKSSAEGM